MTKTSWKSKVPAVQKWVSCQILRSGCLSFFWQLRALKNKARAASSASFQARALGAVKGVYKEPSASAEERRIPLRRTMPPSEAAPAPEGRIPESLSVVQDRVRNSSERRAGPRGWLGAGRRAPPDGEGRLPGARVSLYLFCWGRCNYVPPTDGTLSHLTNHLFAKKKNQNSYDDHPNKTGDEWRGPVERRGQQPGRGRRGWSQGGRRADGRVESGGARRAETRTAREAEEGESGKHFHI
jgi:hypothetical protein